MVLQELLDWEYKKELQIGLVYRYACTSTGIIEKEPVIAKTISAMITHSGRSQASRSIGLTEVLTSSNPIERLLSAQAAEDVANPSLTIRREIRARWRCTQSDCDSQS